MRAIIQLLEELKRSEWADISPIKKYNDVSIMETEILYEKKLSSLYSIALSELLELSSEKYEIIHKILLEVEETQLYFEIPSDEQLSNLLSDYERNRTIKGLKEDYDYLRFVRGCMNIQMYFLEKFKKIIPSTQKQKLEVKENEVTILENNEKHDEPIKGVKGLAAYLKICVTKAQDIINSNVLQDNGIAYRVGNAWNFHPQKLEELLSKQPTILYKRNK